MKIRQNALILVFLTATLSLFLMYVEVFERLQVRVKADLWENVKSNAQRLIKEMPTIDDENPTSITFTDKQWWALYGYAYTSDETHELFLNFNVEWGAGWSLIDFTLDGQYTNFNVTGRPDWNENTNTLFGNIQGVSTSGNFKLTFNPNEYRVWTINFAGDVLKVETWVMGVPSWAGKTLDDAILVTKDPDGTPIYAGGFTEVIIINATLTKTLPAQTLVFHGFGAYARGWMYPFIKTRGYWTLLFVNSQPEFYLHVFDSHNPETNEIFTHRGFIGFPEEELHYEFSDFTVWDSGGGRPQTYRIQGTFETGQVDITGERVGWIQYGQVHPYIHWTGTITRNGKVINVDSKGSGEIFRRWVWRQ